MAFSMTASYVQPHDAAQPMVAVFDAVVEISLVSRNDLHIKIPARF